MKQSLARVCRRAAFIALIACVATPLVASARDSRMDPSERSRLREELRERYAEQRRREARREVVPVERLRPELGEAPGAGPAPSRASRRLSPEEMQTLREQLREQGERGPGEWSERARTDRGQERGDERSRRGRGRGDDGERGGFRQR